jgi:hypothetical protein
MNHVWLIDLLSSHNRFIWHIIKIKEISLHVSWDFDRLIILNLENKERGPDDPPPVQNCLRL